MTNLCPIVTLSPRDDDAILFDLDGVLTKTANVHAAAWKRLFDEFLEQRSLSTGEAFVPFDIDTDYRRYVDGKLRYDGVTSFLKSRGIELPFGPPGADPGIDTVRALSNMKDSYFMQHLRQQGVEIYEPAIDLVRTFREQDVKTAVVSSSVNCAAVLEAAGISHLFDTRVDGVDITRLTLKGKPAPMAQAARLRTFVDGEVRAVSLRTIEEPGYIGQELTSDLQQGQTLALEKLVSFYTSRDKAISECGLAARKAMARGPLRPDHGTTYDGLEALMASLRRAAPAGRLRVQAE